MRIMVNEDDAHINDEDDAHKSDDLKSNIITFAFFKKKFFYTYMIPNFVTFQIFNVNLKYHCSF